MKILCFLLCLLPLSAGAAAPRHVLPIRADLVGRSVADVHARFVSNLERHITANPEVLNRLSTRELVLLHGLYSIRGGTALQPMLAAHAQLRGLALQDRRGATVDMTIEEIYLEFRTAPGAALSIEGALYETAYFVGLRLSGAFGLGVTVGSTIYNVAETLDPEFADHIGEYIDSFGAGLDDYEGGGGAGDGSLSGPGGVIREF